MNACQRLNNCCLFRGKRWISIIFAMLELFWFGGYHYGFNSLIPAFESLGLFAYNCTSTGCEYKSEMFGTSFIVWVVVQMVMDPLSGLFMDKVGLRALKLAAAVLYFTGTLMFAFTNGKTTPLLFIGGIFVAIGSTQTLICDLQISSLFPKARGLSVSLLSGSFDSSSVLAYVLSKTYQTFSLKISFIIVACSSVVVGLFMSLFIMKAKSSDMCSFQVHKETESKKFGSENVEKKTDDLDIGKKNIQAIMFERIKERFPTLKSCVISLPFLLIIIWFALGLFRFSTMLSKLHDRLNELFGNDEKLIKHLLIVSSIFGMCGLVVAPISGLLIIFSQNLFCNKVSNILNYPYETVTNKKLYYTFIAGFVIPFTTMNCFAILMSVLSFIPNKFAIYGSFICLVIVRSLLFSCTIGFLLMCFPINYFGTLNGITSITGGLFSLLQYAFLSLNYKVTDGIATALSVCSLTVPALLLIKSGVRCSRQKRFYLP